MVSRAESATATRQALLDAAADLLDEGGPDAVTLRAVGARAGVSRGAPYGHFPDKEHLLAAVATRNWEAVGDQVDTLIRDKNRSPKERLEGALTGLMQLGRKRPHTYALMFAAPSDNHPEALAAVSRTHDQLLTIVTTVIGDPHRAKPIGALLMSSVHGIVAMENSGQLTPQKWETTGDALLTMLIDRIA